MPSLTNIASSSLSAYKLALETVGNNIANVNTEGYSRQTIDFQTQRSQFIGRGYVGSGVTVKSIDRLTSDFKTRLMHEASSDYHLYKDFYDRAQVIDSIFAQEATDISENMQVFFNALEQSNEMPDVLSSRNVAMGQATFIADQFNNIQKILDDSQNSINQQLIDLSTTVNSLSSHIANINSEIMTGNHAPELFDERDQAIQELSAIVDVETNQQTDGSVTVMIGRGESLVIGGVAGNLSVARDTDTGRSELNLVINSVSHEITRNITGGTFEGMLNYENKVLRETSRQLGLMAVALAENFNRQNKLGMDYNNQIGQNIFNDFNDSQLQVIRAVANNNNPSGNSLSMNIELTDISQLQNSDYQLIMDSATTGTVLRESDGKIFNIDTSNTATMTIDGFTMSFSGAPQDDDRFSISPTRGMANYFEVVQTDPEALALASPVRARSDLNNLSNATIKIDTVIDTTATDLATSFTFDITAVDPINNQFSYSLDGGTTSTTVSYGDVITVPSAGYSVIIEGSVKVGDKFYSEFNQDGIGDNQNGILLTNIQQTGLINGGTETLIDRYSHMISNLGTATYEAKVRSESADVLFRQAEAQKLSDVGVSLDEEAANLVSLQQAYQASGQLVAVSRQMMDIIFSVLS